MASAFQQTKNLKQKKNRARLTPGWRDQPWRDAVHEGLRHRER